MKSSEKNESDYSVTFITVSIIIFCSRPSGWLIWQTSLVFLLC